MCWADVKIGRNKNQGTIFANPAFTGGGVTVLPPNVNRAAVAVSLGSTANTVAFATVEIRAGDRTGPTIATISIERPSILLKIEDYGPLITGGIAIIGGVANEVSVSVVELTFNKEPADQ